MLETERLILRNYKESDFEDYYEYASNPNVGPRCGWQPYDSKEKAFERLKLECQKPYQFAIVWKETNKVIGSIELMNTKTERYPFETNFENSKEIGFLLSPAFWGKAIMPEATKEVLRFAFEKLNVPEVFISHAKANIQSGRVQDKLGFKIIGEVKNYRTWIDGNLTDSVCRKMTKEEWFNKN